MKKKIIGLFISCLQEVLIKTDDFIIHATIVKKQTNIKYSKHAYFLIERISFFFFTHQLTKKLET